MSNYENFDKFCLQTMDAVQILYEKKLFGQLLVIIYSAIDTFGFIDSELSNDSATGKTFQNWVQKYILNSNVLNVTKLDLWAARCGVLHTHTSESDFSKKDTAKEIQYFLGKRTNPMIKLFLEITPKIEEGKHTPLIIEEFVTEFCKGIVLFESDFKIKLSSDDEWSRRLSKILKNQILIK